ncbi:MAG: hypothetical protein Q8S84_07900 [bacterium]|nr:hypothetical protein [bacterium]MDP3381361.1 hypothetical protein [bacterium]
MQLKHKKGSEGTKVLIPPPLGTPFGKGRLKNKNIEILISPFSKGST